MADEISEEGRRQRFARWEQLGVDQVKQDLLNSGDRVVGGPPAVRELAWEWVRMKENAPAPSAEKQSELFIFKPNFHGIGIGGAAALVGRSGARLARPGGGKRSTARG